MLTHTYLNAFAAVSMYKKPTLPCNILKMSSNFTYTENELKSAVNLLRLFRTAIYNRRITLILLMLMITEYKTATLQGTLISRMLEVAGSISSRSNTLHSFKTNLLLEIMYSIKI